MGRRYSASRVSFAVQSASATDASPRPLQDSGTTGACYRPVNRCLQADQETSGGGTSPGEPGPGILFPGVSSSEKGYGRRPIGDQPPPPQCGFSPAPSAFSHGVLPVSAHSTPPGGLDDVIGLTGCVPPYPHTPSALEVPSFHGRVPLFRISGPSVRPGLQSLGVQQSVHTGGHLSTCQGSPVPFLSGRFHAPQLMSDHFDTGNQFPLPVTGSPGVHHSRGEIRLEPIPVSGVSRRPVQYGPGFGLSAVGPLGEDSSCSPAISWLSRTISSPVCVAPRSSDVGSGSDAQRSLTTSAANASLERSLVRPDPQSPDPGHLKREAVSSVVVGASPRHGRCLTPPVPPDSPCLHGRIRSGVGCPLRLEIGFRFLDRPAVSLAHKCVGTSSGHPGVPSLFALACQSLSLDCNRQHHSFVVHQSSGRHPLQASAGVDADVFPPVLGPRHYSQGSSHSGSSECLGGRPLPSRSDPQHGVATTSGHPHPDSRSLGDAASGFVCNTPQSPTSGLHLSSARSSRAGNRRTVGRLDGDDSVRVPSPGPRPESPTENQATPVCAVSNHSLVACPALVSRSPGSPDRSAPGPASVATPVATAPAVSSATAVSQPTRLQVLERQLTSAGFSRQAADRMVSSTRRSTATVYEYKWRQFVTWCHERDIVPTAATVQQLAEFFLYLLHVRKLAPRTVEGYRTALSRVIELESGRNPSLDKNLAALIRSFRIDRQFTAPLLPKWDLALVLRSLHRPPYEPLDHASLKDLSYKTCFLLAFASAARVSELHALDVRSVKHDRAWSRVMISTLPDFVAKNQAIDNTIPQEFSIPALADFLGPGLEDDNLLCPVRSLAAYLTRTKPVRAGRRRLFIPFARNSPQEISKNTVASWLAKTIRCAYPQEPNAATAFHRVTAHEVRALASSWPIWTNRSVADILRACSWRSNTTFTSYYLRDMTYQRDDMYSLGPVVAAQRVAPAPCTSRH